MRRAPLNSSNWKLNGNNASSGDFLGTGNNFPLEFRTNNTQRMVLGANGVLKINNLQGTGNRFLQADASGNLVTFPNGSPTEVLYGNGIWGSLPLGATSWSVIGNNIFYSNSGNVGIGTNNPLYKLQVIGDASVSNNLYVGGGIIVADKIHAAHTVTTGLASVDTIVMNGGSGRILGQAEFTGDIKADSKLTVNGNATFNGNLKIANLAGGGDREIYANSQGNILAREVGPNAPPHPYACNSLAHIPWYVGGNYFSNLNLPIQSSIGTCDNRDFIVMTNSVFRTWFKPDGKIGFGTSNPGDKYHFTDGNVRIDGTAPHIGSIAVTGGYNRALIVNGDVSLANYFPTNASGNPGNGMNGIEILGNDQIPVRRGISVDADPNGHFNFYIHSFQSNSYFKFINGANANELMTIDAGGRVWIGNQKQATGPHTNFALAVDGKIVAKSCYIRILDWADNVFDKEYKLPDLYDIEKYYIANKHLPEIPTEKEVLENGVDIAEMNKLLLKKIEELTVLMVKQQKEIDRLKKKD